MSAQGILEGIQCSKYFIDKTIDLILASPYRRSLETAQILANVTKCKIIVEPRLGARLVPDVYRDKSRDELYNLRNQYNHNFLNLTHDWLNVEGTESLEVVYKRVFNALKDHNFQNRNLLCVSHAVVIKNLIKQYLGFSNEEFSSFKIKTGQVVKFENVGFPELS